MRHGACRKNPENNPLNTGSGKIGLLCQTIADMNLPDRPSMPTWLEPAGYLRNAPEPHMVHVVSPHPYNRIHSRFAQSDLRRELNVTDREFVRTNTEDAERRGIEDGDLVGLSNDRGTVIAGARVADKIMPGVVSLYERAGVSFDSKGRCNSRSINALTSSRRASALSQATTANTCLAKLRKAADIEGPNRPCEPPTTIDELVSPAPETFGLERAEGITESFLASMEPGETLFYERCTFCHIPRDPKGLTRKERDSITESMFANAGVTKEGQAQILDFLYKNAKDACVFECPIS